MARKTHKPVIDELRINHLLGELGFARMQNEHMLATIRQLYDHIREQQTRRVRDQAALKLPKPRSKLSGTPAGNSTSRRNSARRP